MAGALTTPADTRTGPDDSLDEFVNTILVASRVLVAISARTLAEVENAVTLTQLRTLVVLDSHDGINLNGLA